MGCGSKNEEIRVCGQKCHFGVSAATFLKIIRILRFFGVFTFLCDLIFHILLYFLLKLTKNLKKILSRSQNLTKIITKIITKL
jgi:hypothetical protein